MLPPTAPYPLYISILLTSACSQCDYGVKQAIDEINDEIIGVFKHHVDERELSIDPIRSDKSSMTNEKMTSMFAENKNIGHHDTKLPFQVPLPPPNNSSSATAGNQPLNTLSLGVASMKDPFPSATQSSSSNGPDATTVLLRLNLLETKMDLLGTKLDLVLSELRHLKGK